MTKMPEFAACNPKMFDAFKSMQHPSVFAFAPTDTGVELRIYDVIGSEQTNATTFAAALDEAAGAPLTIRLSSPGGSVFDGWAMYNLLRNYAGNSTVIVDGVCASIATAIALGADQVQTAQASLWMVHRGWLATIDNAAGLRESAAVLDKIDANLAQIYAGKTGKPPEEWAKLMEAETWFNADEALAAGLVNAICPDPEKTPALEPQKAKATLISAPNAQVIDPDEDGDDDGADACGMINSAILLLQECIETLTATPDMPIEDGMMDALKQNLQMQQQLRMRRAMVAALV